MSSYQANIPQGTTKLSVDWVNIKNNFAQLDTSYGINHFSFSNGSGKKGKHKFVNMPNLNSPVTDVTPPASLVSGDGAVYTARPGVSTELFYANDGTGAEYQITNASAAVPAGNFAKFATNPGWTFLPGGLIMQWGSVTATTTGSFTAQAFPITFLGGCYGVFTQVYGTGSAPSSGGEGNVTIRKSTLTGANITQFNWAYITGSATYTGFFWWAIGF